MDELSLHILDIAQNSIDANANNVQIDVVAKGDMLSIVITDDGEGMDATQLANCQKEHFSTKGSQGIGLSLFASECQLCGGQCIVQSSKGVGTRVEGTFLKFNRKPLGDIGQTIAPILSDKFDVRLNVVVDEKKYSFDTRAVKEQLNGASIQSPSIVVAIKKLINENIYEIGGAEL